MKSNRMLFLAAIFSLILTSSLIAQVRIDVKTKWLEKKELTATKGGVIAAIDAAPSMVITEFGEDYALWLKNLHRTTEGEELVVLTLDLELRKPSLVSEGDLIAKSVLVLRYDPRSLDSLRSEPEMTATIRAQHDQYDHWNRLIAGTLGNLVPKGGAIIAPILTALLQEVNEAPAPEEICEAVLVGVRVVEWLQGRVSS